MELIVKGKDRELAYLHICCPSYEGSFPLNCCSKVCQKWSRGPASGELRATFAAFAGQ